MGLLLSTAEIAVDKPDGLGLRLRTVAKSAVEQAGWVTVAAENS